MTSQLSRRELERQLVHERSAWAALAKQLDECQGFNKEIADETIELLKRFNALVDIAERIADHYDDTVDVSDCETCILNQGMLVSLLSKS